jgi:hypothetical protein
MKLPIITSPRRGTQPKVHRKYAKITLWLTALTVACIVVAVSLFIYAYNVGFGSPAHPDFIGYKPAILPNNTKIVGQTLSRQHITGMDIWNFFYTLNLNNRDLTISESQKDPSEPSIVSCQGYGGYCAIYRTAKSYTYRVWYNNYNSKPYGMAVDWVEGNTDVTIGVGDSVTANYVNYNWAPLFDSMRPVELDHMSYTKYDSCQCGG